MTVSSTGIATPSIDARVMGPMGFRPDISRVPVFGLGCAGGVTGLSIAARLAEARPGSTVLLVVIELCTLAFRMDTLTKANVVASALFGDGAAACVLRTGGQGLARIAASGEHTWPDTLDIMGWNVDPLGFGVVFAQAIPPFARQNVGPAVTEILERSASCDGDVDRFVCHPGGSKVIEALETALGLPAGSLDHEREVLESHGNMSAPTVLFVLERVIADGLPELSRRQRHGAGLFHQLRGFGESRVTLGFAVLLFVTLQRGGELLIARRNTRRLMARGAVEVASGHYPLIVLLHASWLVGSVVARLEQAGASRAGSRPSRPCRRAGSGFWSPSASAGRPASSSCPARRRFAAAPTGSCRIPITGWWRARWRCLPLAFGLPVWALTFSILNAAVLAIRIRAENRAWAEHSLI